MKDQYTSPEVEVTCFSSEEKVAADGSINFSDLVAAAGKNPAASVGNDDINVKL